MKTYGYKADSLNPPWENVKTIIGNMKKNTYFHRLNTNSYHNLCTNLKPPDGIGILLGLGLKFCIQTQRPISASIDKSIDRFTRDVRLKYAYVGYEEEDENEYNKFNPKLYIKSDWLPPVAPPEVENRINLLR